MFVTLFLVTGSTIYRILYYGVQSVLDMLETSPVLKEIMFFSLNITKVVTVGYVRCVLKIVLWFFLLLNLVLRLRWSGEYIVVFVGCYSRDLYLFFTFYNSVLKTNTYNTSLSLF